MSEILQYMQASVQSYLDELIDVSKFREQFAGAYFYARNHAHEEGEANRLASKLIGPIAEFSGGYRSELSLRTELANAIRPFVQRERIRCSHVSQLHASANRLEQHPLRPPINALVARARATA